MKYYQTFIVSGKGVFPYDMLRYDHCWSGTQDSVIIMCRDSDFNFLRHVNISRYVHTKTEMPTIGRWASFGWTVSNVETKKIS